MNKSKSVSFVFEDLEYEIKIEFDGTSTIARAFLDGKPANGFTYQIDLITEADLGVILGYSPIKELINAVKDDVCGKNWETGVKELKKIECAVKKTEEVSAHTLLCDKGNQASTNLTL